MRYFKSLIKLALGTALIFTIFCPSMVANATEGQTPAPTQKAEKKAEAKDDILTVISNKKELSTLVGALKAAGLIDALEGEGPFTLFAPSNAAFEQIPKETLEKLLKPENKDKLEEVLTYHVFAGNLPAVTAEKLNGKEITMLNNKPVKVTMKNGVLYLNDARVLTKDIKASNGVIHVIDMVLVPTS